MCVFWTHHRTDTLWHLSCLPVAQHHALKVCLLQHVLAPFIPFEGQVIVRCMDIPHFLHPLSHFWTLSFGNCAVFLCINFCWKTHLSFLGGECPAAGLLVTMITFLFYVLWNCPVSYVRATTYPRCISNAQGSSVVSVPRQHLVQLLP